MGIVPENIIEEAEDLCLELVHQLAQVLVRTKERPRQGRGQDLWKDFSRYILGNGEEEKKISRGIEELKNAHARDVVTGQDLWN